MSPQDQARGGIDPGNQGLKVIGDGPGIARLRTWIRMPETCPIIGQAPDPLLRQQGLDDEPVSRAAKGAAFQHDQRSAFRRPCPHRAQIPAADIDPFAPQDGPPEVAGGGAISTCRPPGRPQGRR
jgi:hypothetical protein